MTKLEKKTKLQKTLKNPSDSFILWLKPDKKFVSKRQISSKHTFTLASDIQAKMPYECFKNIFLHFLYLYIA